MFNTAFFEQWGPEGLKLLSSIVDELPPDVAVILDAKRGDIANTAAAYARALYDCYHADAVSVSPYMGRDAITPFLKYSKSGCVFAECRPAGGKGICKLKGVSKDGATCALVAVYEHVAKLCKEIAADATSYNSNAHLGLLIGAEEPEEAEEIWKFKNSNSNFLFLLDLHCDVSSFFSRVSAPANGGENSLNGSNLIVCINPPDINEAAAFARKARQQLDAAFSAAG